MAKKGGARSGVTLRVDADIREDIEFQERTWAVQRAGWAIMLLLVAAAAIGLFSGGPLSRSVTNDAKGMVAVDYERFIRYRTPTMLRLKLAPASTVEGRVSVQVSQGLADAFEIRHIRPEPERMWAMQDGMQFEFAVAEAGTPATITFTVEPQSIGSIGGEIGLVGSEPARLSQFVYP